MAVHLKKLALQLINFLVLFSNRRKMYHNEDYLFFIALILISVVFLIHHFFL